MGQVQEGISQLQDTLARTVECDDCKDPYNHSACSAATWSGDEGAFDASAYGASGGQSAEDVGGAFAEEVYACAASALVLLPPGLRLVILGGTPGRVPDEACAKLIRKLARRLAVALPGQLVVLLSGKPGVQSALATGLGDSPALVHLLPDGASLVGTPGRRVNCGRTARLRDAALLQLGQVFLVFEGDPNAVSAALVAARSGATVLPVHCSAGEAAQLGSQLRPEWVTSPEWACLGDKSSPNVVAAGVMAILVKAARREHVEATSRRCTADVRKSSPIFTCLDPEHVRYFAGVLEPEDAAHLESHEFLDACDRAFHAADSDSSGFLEVGHEAGQIGDAVREVLPAVFRDPLDGMHAQNYALSFDPGWDGKLDFDEFVSFCQWAAMMQARGLFRDQARFHCVGSGQGDRLLIVADYLDMESTLYAAVKSGIDVASYSPSSVTALDFAQRVAGARRLRERAGLGPYKSVAIASHGVDANGLWSPFAGVARKLTSALDVEHLVPVFVELASLLPKKGGGRLDLLSCNLAGSPGGMFFVKRLEEETGQCVCATKEIIGKDVAGSVEQGGNWISKAGDLNVAPDYFDEGRLRDFDRLMRLKLTKQRGGSRSFSRLSSHRRPSPSPKPKKTSHRDEWKSEAKANPTRRGASGVRDYLDNSSSGSE